MYHPPSIPHLGQNYSLAHLASHFDQFDWLDREKISHRYRVKVRYSAHCYSEELDLPLPAGSYQVPDKRVRIFCPIRHAHSLRLPALISGLFRKPSTSIAMTREHNWTIYALNSNPPLAPGQRYSVFFRIKKRPPIGFESAHPLEIFVESAYAREERVHIRENSPFGKIAERVSRK